MSFVIPLETNKNIVVRPAITREFTKLQGKANLLGKKRKVDAVEEVEEEVEELEADFEALEL